LNHGTVESGRFAIFRKQRHLAGARRAMIQRADSLAPRSLLAVVDLSQIQDVTLYDAPAGAAPVLDNTKGAMILAVLAANLGA
jgi:hypothetical protein